MSSDRFTADLLRASADGFAGLAAGRLHEEAEPRAAGDFSSWKAQLRTQVLELAAAVEDGLPERFGEHVAWTRDAFVARGLSPQPLEASVRALQAVLSESLPSAAAAQVAPCFDAARAALARPSAPAPSELEGPAPEEAARYLAALRAGDERGATALLVEAVAGGRLGVEEALTRVLAPVLREVGRLWHRGELSVAEEHFASTAARRALERLTSLGPPPAPNGHSVLLTTVEGDAHDFGTLVTAAFFERAGWRVLSLGANTPAEDVAQAARRHEVDLVVLGTSLDTHRAAAARTVAAVRAERPAQRVLLGGPAFARPRGAEERTLRRAGADAYAASPEEALRLGLALVEGDAPE